MSSVNFFGNSYPSSNLSIGSALDRHARALTRYYQVNEELWAELLTGLLVAGVKEAPLEFADGSYSRTNEHLRRAISTLGAMTDKDAAAMALEYNQATDLPDKSVGNIANTNERKLGQRAKILHRHFGW
jgi:hypothetical protein